MIKYTTNDTENYRINTDFESFKLRDDYQKNLRLRDSIPAFEEYLKLFESNPVILGRIRDMNAMDTLLHIFFSNFTITAANGDFRKGLKVSYKLNEPYEGFVKNNDFVLGALRPKIFTPIY